jgi:phosphatidylserine decarboxylase
MIHKEGYRIVSVGLLFVALVLFLLWSFSNILVINLLTTVALLLVWLFVLRFFRKPNRKNEVDDRAIIAPADGLVVSTDDAYDEHLFRSKQPKIAIFMSGLDVHINWVPMSGTVNYYKYEPGKHLMARNPKSSELNERAIIGIKHNSGSSILVKQVAGIMARRVVTYAKPGSVLSQGNELGFIKFGSRLELFLPANIHIAVKPGQRVTGGVTVLAYLP